ncbi:MAG: ABC transporter ATP-binding protein [Planctomycetota bacterium]|nr:ABC transporter ATP-binding protein [Planctomycetota bacterium]
MIELSHVTKLYGMVIGANDIDLSLEPGAYGILGPNGSGKTTFMNLVTGQIRPNVGTVRTFGQDPWDNAEVLGQIGLCPEQDLPYSNVTGAACVEYLLHLHGFDRKEARKRARETLDRVGMANAMDRLIGTYSLGMRQRTKLAQAFAHRPRLLILDEPFNGLDPVGRHEMTEFFREWILEGRSLLLASHILYEVEAVTSSFILICSGRLLASGTAEEVRRLLADVPHEIRIRCDPAPVLARLLLDSGLIEGVRFEGHGDVVVVSTRSPASLYERLPSLLEGTEVRVREVRSPDESLQSLFESLLLIHRGGRT